MVKRQFPNPKDLLQLMQFKKPTLNGKKRHLDSALTIYDLRTIAKRRTPKAAFDYTDGSAEGELSLARARQAFEDIEFHPSILRDVSQLDTTTRVLGGTSAMPFGIAPTGFTRLMHTEGGIAGAGAAAAAGIPFTLSTLGTSSIEAVKAANPEGRNWFQLYVMRQREISYGLVERAAAAGFDTLMFTVDTPVAGARLRDKRNGFSIPPQLTLGTIVNAVPRPWWWWDFLTTPPLQFASLSSTGVTMALIFVPFYVAGPVVSDPHSVIVQIFTYFPFSAPTTALLRNGLGTLGLLESVIVIAILFICAAAMLRLAVSLFQYGSIAYTKRVSLKSVLTNKSR